MLSHHASALIFMWELVLYQNTFLGKDAIAYEQSSRHTYFFINSDRSYNCWLC
ncbi:hypothetical protein [Calothrix sp. NIES-2098]|uniref:hypothetical protein n=1 Tax=Calothrix sp. NIES-2098 TaxID=1954171 RepID=UPI0030DDAB60